MHWPWDWDQIGIKLETQHVKYQNLANEKHVNILKSVLFGMKMCITDQNIMLCGTQGTKF